MNKTMLSRSLYALALCFALPACAASVCERKDNWFANHCTGTDVTWSKDASCESTLDKCNAGQLQAANAYVACLESQNQCSLDTIAQCAQAHPGGVNLMCTGG